MAHVPAPILSQGVHLLGFGQLEAELQPAIKSQYLIHIFSYITFIVKRLNRKRIKLYVSKSIYLSEIENYEALAMYITRT